MKNIHWIFSLKQGTLEWQLKTENNKTQRATYEMRRKQETALTGLYAVYATVHYCK